MSLVVRLRSSLGLSMLWALVAVASADAQRVLPDDPLRVDHDTLPIEKPGEVELSTLYDVFEHTFKHRPGDAIPRAQNANTLGEVPNSSWFTNRIGVRDMSIDEIVRGPETTGGPDLSQPLTIIAGKSGGITPGFTIQDARGDIYFVKFDPRKHPNLSTAPDVIVSKFFYMFGYNVPENYIAYLQPEQLRIGPKARVKVRGKKTPMGPAYLEEVFSKAAAREDGSIRVIASRGLQGEPVGPFKFYGTRGDDPNDIVPHEHRRELRGYRVFCAWLNHDDSRSLNTLDMYVRNGERGHLVHNLIDFSSTLGSGSNAARQIAPQNPRAGNEYIMEAKPFLKTAFSLGLWERPWRKVKYEYPMYAELGRIESQRFQPQLWKSEYPNPAFERMQLDDAFWATRIVARVSDEAIGALVRQGQYTSKAAEQHLTQTLIERRDKIVRYYFSQLNPLDAFRIEGDELVFRNLGEEAGIARAQTYEYEWFTFGNQTETSTALAVRGTSRRPRLALPSADAWLQVRLRTRSDAAPLWHKAVDVYIRMRDRSVVGIEREL